MRAVEVAKRIGITTQELRKELGIVNFGIKPTEREIEDGIAMGIVRVLRNKYPDRVPSIVDDIVEDDTENAESNEDQEESAMPAGEEVKEEKKSESKVKKKPARKKQSIDTIKFIKVETEDDEEEEDDEESSSSKDEKKTKKKTSSNDDDVEKTGGIHGKNLKKKKKYDQTEEEEENIEFQEVKKPKKRVKITHKLTLDDVKEKEGDIASLEEEMIELEMERDILKEQRKKKAKSKKVVKKEMSDQEQIKQKTGVVELPEVVLVKEFAEKTGIQVPKVISELMKNGILATINQTVDFDTASLIAEELGVKVKKLQKDMSTEEMIEGDIAAILKDDAEHGVSRPPIVTVMGHVDHGKTQLLDTIRQANVVAGESGGITQHVAAYQVQHNGKKITFIDTPGHAAFTSMRARGAKLTDIAILVVAADEGMKPQTIEAMNHAKEAGVTIIVAINKIDKEGANIDMVKGQLTEHELTPEDWGGKTIVVPVSALKNQNIDQLLEMILLVSEMEDYKASKDRNAIATVVEAHLDPSLGAVATVIVNAGTLKVMDSFVVGDTFGRVKMIQNDTGEKVKKLPPSGAALIAGFDTVPVAGDVVQVLKDEKAVKQKVAEIADLKLQQKVAGGGLLMDELVRRIAAGKMTTLKLVLKADTKGSLEAITQALAKIEHDEVAPKIIHAGVGDITETDVMMASASQGIVLGFHVGMPILVEAIAEKENVECRKYQVIYDLTDDIKRLLSGLLEPERVETILGHMQVREIFMTKRKVMIIGGKVTDGVIKVKHKFRLLRGEEIITEGTINSLRKVKDDVKEVKDGNECGMQVESSEPIEVGDVLEVYDIELRERSL